MLNNLWLKAILLFCCLISFGVAQDNSVQKVDSKIEAEDDYPGTPDLEEASKIRVTSESRASLGKVIELCQSALQKGLDEIDTATAKSIIAATAVQKAKVAFEENSGRVSQTRAQRIANEALADLQLAIDSDASNVEAYILKTRLHMLRQEKKKALETLNLVSDVLAKASKQDAASPEAKAKLSDIYLMKASLEEDVDDQIRDLKKSIEFDPENERAVQQAIENLSALGRNDEAREILNKQLAINRENEYAIKRLATLLLQEDKVDEAITFLNEAIREFPHRSVLYAIRADVYLRTERIEDALADAKKSLELQPKDLGAKLVGIKANIILKNYKEAHEQIDELEQAAAENASLKGTLQQEVILLRRNLALMEKRYGDAIALYERLAQLNPDNEALMLELGSFYQMDNRHKKALRIADRLIKADDSNWQAYRLRGDVYLAMGKHADAIKDFEVVLDNMSDDDDDYSGILNNLSWVLATSPDDKVRDGNRALELGLKACEQTDYEKPHILSTLAAAYGELGQFDKAIQWSEKAVELGRKEGNEQVEQLEEELKSYRAKKPWREVQKPTEAPAKAQPVDSGLDT